MFGNLGLHGIKFPSGKFGFVGSVPVELCTLVPASANDVLGNRAFRNEKNDLVTWKIPIFDSRESADEFAKSKGFTVKW